MGVSRKVLVLAGAALLLSTGALAQQSGFRGAPTSDNETTRDLEKGIAALQEKRYVDARQAFERILQVASEDSNVLYLAGMSYAGLEDYKNARRYFERALRAKKDHVGAQQQLGLAFLKIGDRPKAEAQLTKLKSQQEKCAAKCVEAGALAQAIDSLAAALANPA
jgi:tetratricopeptide (TPR) repeat protein